MKLQLSNYRDTPLKPISFYGVDKLRGKIVNFVLLNSDAYLLNKMI